MPLTMITAVKDIPVHHDHRTEVTPNARAALIDAGWTPPGAEAGQVSTLEELDALPVGTVVYASNHIGPAERFDVGWMGCGNAAAWSSAVLARDGLPARIIHHPALMSRP